MSTSIDIEDIMLICSMCDEYFTQYHMCKCCKTNLSFSEIGNDIRCLYIFSQVDNKFVYIFHTPLYNKTEITLYKPNKLCFKEDYFTRFHLKSVKHIVYHYTGLINIL